jgi:hypothetical protein
MIKKLLLAGLSVIVVLAALAAVMYVMNRAPTVPPISAADVANPAKPYVVKIHAQWCAVCMVTKDVWSEIESAYSGRVNLLVLDLTTEATTAASRAEAGRLGLDRFFDEYGGATGTIVVLDGRTKQVAAAINGSRELAEYRSAIDAALKRPKDAE